ncbi:MAG: hypothetical protein ACE5JI_10960 [Acidobacteriota bacterium]
MARFQRKVEGVVYRALDLKLNRDVAVRAFPAEVAADPEPKRRFVQEARAAAALEHPRPGFGDRSPEVRGGELRASRGSPGDGRQTFWRARRCLSFPTATRRHLSHHVPPVYGPCWQA